MIGNTKNSKSVVKGSSYARRGLTYTILIVVAIIVTGVNFFIGLDARQTIQVLRVKQGEVLNKGAALSDQICEPYDIVKKEYTTDMILYKNKEKYYSMYSKNYIRGGNEVHIDETTDVKPVRNAWLYSLAPGTEVITIPYNPTELAGKILIPGDKVKVRVTYSEGNTSNANEKKTLTLFDAIEVKDMINSSSQSIFDIYDQLNKLSDASRKKAMTTTEFATNIQPVALMVAVPSDQAEKYNQYKNQYKSTFSMTLLSRNGNDSSSMDDIPIMAPDVDAWVKNGTTSNSDIATAGAAK